MARRSSTPVARTTAFTAATTGLAAVVVALSGAAGAAPPVSAASSTSTTRPVVAATATATATATTTAASSPSAGVQTALGALASVTVKGRAPKTGYTRDQFGAAWADVDKNGCDTRDDVLKRDLTAVTFVPGTRSCVVATGTLADLYSGRTIAFKRGPSTSAAVQIDHVVPLSDAWQKGAQSWTGARRTAFANDPLNLLAADGPLNGAKGDSDAATWLPPNTAFRCAYVARQVAVKLKYGVWMTAAERDAIRAVLTTCPKEPLPTSAAAPRLASPAPTPTTTATPAAAAKPTNKPTAKPTSKVSYANCTAVRAAGKAPIHRGDPGWDPKFDRDGDGTGCER